MVIKTNSNLLNNWTKSASNNIKSNINSISQSIEKFQLTKDTVSFSSSNEMTELMLSTTYFFRDKSIQELVNLLGLNFLTTVNSDISQYDKPPIEIFSYAGSDGSEGYSIAIGLIKMFGEEKAKKLFKINVLDVSQQMIDRGNKSISYLNSADVLKVKDVLGDKFPQFFIPQNKKKRIGHRLYYIYKISPKLKDMIEFSKADFFEEITKQANKVKFSGNRVILFRNALYHYKNTVVKGSPYFEDRIDQISHFMTDTLDSKALVCFGKLDAINVKLILQKTKDKYNVLFDEDGIILQKK